VKGIGAGERRLDGHSKITGSLAYTGDIELAGLTHAKLVLSPHPSAVIKGYELDAARRVPGVVAVVSGDDLGRLPVAPADSPLARGTVNYEGRPVVAVIAETEAAAADGAAQVRVEYEPRPAVVDPLEAVKPDAPPVFDVAGGLDDDDSESHGAAVAASDSSQGLPNVPVEVHVSHGDVKARLAGAAHIVSGRWVIPRVNQASMETHVCIASREPLGGMTVWTSTQSPFEIRSQVSRVLGLPPPSVRVVSMPVGGGFGNKATAVLEPLIAALSQHVGRPVKCQLSRQEEFLLTAASGAVIDIELGADSDGILCGLRVNAWFDCGVRKSGGSRLGAWLLCGTYRLPAYSYDALDVVTNKAPSLPYRAPSAIGFFALESALDELARKMALDPIELRLRNASREGDPQVGGGTWPLFGLVECLEAARRHPVWMAPIGAGEGIGVAAASWSGAAGPGTVSCGVEQDGSLTLTVGYADITGADTTYALIAADILGQPAKSIRVQNGDTSSAPYSGQAGGSRSIHVVGAAVADAVGQVRRQLLNIAAEELEAAAEDMVMTDGLIHVAGLPQRALSVADIARSTISLNSRHAPLWAASSLSIPNDSPLSTVHICRVKVDPETGSWHIAAYAVVQDVGRALNPPEIAGQIHGGVLQSVARAVGEQLVHDSDGVLRTASFLDYELPSIDQAVAPEIELIELPSPTGPFGAKGVGEPPAIPGSAAVATALRAATGARFNVLPISWFEVLQAGANAGRSFPLS
jgi:CO/xanthine dehydrogenase Mo-binding subunit